MPQGLGNAFLEAMNGLMQNAERAARGFKTSTNFNPIAYLRLFKLRHLSAHPLEHAAPRFAGVTTRRCRGQAPCHVAWILACDRTSLAPLSSEPRFVGSPRSIPVSFEH